MVDDRPLSDSEPEDRHLESRPRISLVVNLDHPESAILDTAGRILLDGGVILCPTDTIYGLSCLAFREDAIEQVLELKGRPPEKGLLVLIPDLSWIARLAEKVSPDTLGRLERLWPGPVTVLLRGASDLPRLLCGAAGKVGIRWPSLPFLERLLSRVGEPVVSTSANRGGVPYTGDVRELRRTFSEGVDLFLEAAPESSPENPPSTVLDLSGSRPRLIREGAGRDRVRKLWKV